MASSSETNWNGCDDNLFFLFDFIKIVVVVSIIFHNSICFFTATMSGMCCSVLLKGRATGLKALTEEEEII